MSRQLVQILKSTNVPELEAAIDSINDAVALDQSAPSNRQPIADALVSAKEKVDSAALALQAAIDDLEN